MTAGHCDTAAVVGGHRGPSGRAWTCREVKSDKEGLRKADPVAQRVVIDDNQYFRKLVRTLLTTVGVKNVAEAGDAV